MASAQIAEPVPYPVQAALIDTAGKAFWLWDPYAHYLRKAGVHPATVARIVAEGSREHTGKYRATRELLAELDRAGAPGRRVQIELVRALVAYQLGDDCTDRQAARDAQARLRATAQEYGLLAPSRAFREAGAEGFAARQRREGQRRRERVHAEQARKRAELRTQFSALLADDSDRQGRGYQLELLFGELARLDELRWTPPFRKGTVDQTDGLLVHENWRYLVEARWRMKPPDVVACAGLAHKASRRLEATRGLFISIEGFRPEVVDELERGVKNLILVSGQELSLILEGRLTLARALQLKHDEGAKKGYLFYDLAASAAV